MIDLLQVFKSYRQRGPIALPTSTVCFSERQSRTCFQLHLSKEILDETSSVVNSDVQGNKHEA